MLRRTLVLVGIAGVALGVAGPAVASPNPLEIRVHIRVEGAKTTIFGAFEPSVTPVIGRFTPPDGDPVTLAAPTPLVALERASRKGEFYYRVQTTSFGRYVDRIGRRAAGGMSGWVYKVNGVSPPVGADVYALEPGDRVLWYYATFGPAGGPPTLDLDRVRRVCFRAYSVDDNGRRTRARDVVFRVDGRRVRSAGGAICPQGHWHAIRATKAGAIRSEALRSLQRLRPAATPVTGRTTTR